MTTTQTTSREELIRKAEQAGKHVGSASQMLRDALRAAYTAGSLNFDDPLISEMREAFRKASASSGKSKNAGNNMFARAWDDLIKKDGLALQPRPRAGAGGKKAKSGKGNGAADPTADASPVDVKALAAALAGKAGLDRDLVKVIVDAFKGLEPLLTGKNAGAVKDARHALKTCGNRINKLLDAAGQGVTKESVNAKAKPKAKTAQKPQQRKAA